MCCILKPYINDCEDILESHIGKKDEQGAIDVHYTILIYLLTKVNDADQQ